MKPLYKGIFVGALLFALVSCASITGSHVAAPSLALEGARVSKIQTHVATSSDYIEQAKTQLKQAGVLNPTLVPTFTLADSRLDNALAENKQALDEIKSLHDELNVSQVQITQLTVERNSLSDRAATLTLKNAQMAKHIMELYLVLVGIGLLAAGYFVAKFYFHIPI